MVTPRRNERLEEEAEDGIDEVHEIGHTLRDVNRQQVGQNPCFLDSPARLPRGQSERKVERGDREKRERGHAYNPEPFNSLSL